MEWGERAGKGSMEWQGQEGCGCVYQTVRPIERASLMYHLALNIVFCCLKRIPAAPVLVVIMLLFSFLNCCWLDKEDGEENRRRGDNMREYRINTISSA